MRMHEGTPLPLHPARCAATLLARAPRRQWEQEGHTVVECGCDTYAIAAWLVQPIVASSVVLLAGPGGHVGFEAGVHG